MSTEHVQEKLKEVPFEMRSIPVPARKMKMIKEEWMKIYTPVVMQCNLQIRMNLARKCIEIRTCKETLSPVSIQRAEEFITAVTLGFSPEDALTILRDDTLYVNCFSLEDVRILRHSHIGRAIGRVAGTKGKIKNNIELITETRIVIEDKNIRVLGTDTNIALARTAISKLIMGSQPSKVCSDLRIISKKVQGRL
ncbi:RNA-binding protein PNO1 [Nematocida major]|uniref:RNA-binding protein PNO1 n=1 Tax=Nematocida major TaxID=1912982 RepID=UPI002007419A|nr:RNA-binding protein PNO1 [Nematocida major]KAH9385236.1 RNA-binding protein PNO1 [Nematocida major]